MTKSPKKHTHNSTSTKKIGNTIQKPEVFSHFFFWCLWINLQTNLSKKPIFFGGPFFLQAGAEVPCYGSIVATLAEAQQWSNALEVLTEMVQQDPLPGGFLRKKRQQKNPTRLKNTLPQNTCLLSQCFFFFFSEKKRVHWGAQCLTALFEDLGRSWIDGRQSFRHLHG